MTIKEKIQADFLTAMREKNEVAKAALSGLKADITRAEKDENRLNKMIDLTDAEVLKIVTKAVKQRKESADAFTKGNRHDLSIKELFEMEIINKYLPAQMTELEIEQAVRNIIPTLLATTPLNIVGGKTMGVFNKQYPGLANPQTLKSVIEKVLGT